MIEIIIIADDLTGAADTGVQFLEMSGRSLKMVGLDHKISSAPCGGLALHTQTRNESAFTAKLAMDRAADVARRMEPKVIYKKIDSCLRGHVGLELGALVQNLNFKGALVAPAYPTFGRVTKEGLHYVGDTLVSESEVARDPIRPVTDSRLEAIIGRGHDCTVCRLGLDIIEKGVEAVTRTIENMLQSDGPVMIAADAVTDHDLDILAEAGLKFKDRLILTGSAGLAGGLARAAADKPQAVEKKGPSGPIIYFGGSTSKSLQQQIGQLAEAGYVEHITIDINQLLESGGELPLPRRPEDGRDLAVVLPPPHDDAPIAGENFSRRLITTFGYYAANLVRSLKPSAIFMCGGDTAQAILSCLNLNELWLRSEPIPGMVYMEAGKMSILTKAGSFGAADILVKLHQSLR
ncbi:hypothetical protein C4J81_08155 [Deltaproteobacteria bacterium Smac51]|nr:hypothetical protein C4J81_08155 [Deltaproteobacteria bacterium Smac51]